MSYELIPLQGGVRSGGYQLKAEERRTLPLNFSTFSGKPEWVIEF
ncbi:MAG: hypothetical protein RLZZ435_2674 [Cyanobacteriota bacterium]|jgi:hypothetical protein